MGKVYPEEVKNKAVELYRLDDKTTYADVGRDLGIPAETIRNWVLLTRIIAVGLRLVRLPEFSRVGASGGGSRTSVGSISLTG